MRCLYIKDKRLINLLISALTIILLSLTFKSYNNENLEDVLNFWVGIYKFYDESQDVNSFDRGEYIITIYPKGDEYLAKISVNGIQVMSRILTKVSGDYEKVNLIFKSYMQYNAGEPYSEGDIVFSLERNGEETIMIWDKFETPSGYVFTNRVENIEILEENTYEEYTDKWFTQEFYNAINAKDDKKIRVFINGQIKYYNITLDKNQKIIEEYVENLGISNLTNNGELELQNIKISLQNWFDTYDFVGGIDMYWMDLKFAFNDFDIEKTNSYDLINRLTILEGDNYGYIESRIYSMENQNYFMIGSISKNSIYNSRWAIFTKQANRAYLCTLIKIN